MAFHSTPPILKASRTLSGVMGSWNSVLATLQMGQVLLGIFINAGFRAIDSDGSFAV
ncbi:MAG: hypothetical protein KAX13_03440 [Candidatus Krumholzibacteria bacterium]|nr:hypothetical protein [Candidatus Krumholzibacteria bacterium]